METEDLIDFLIGRFEEKLAEATTISFQNRRENLLNHIRYMISVYHNRQSPTLFQLNSYSLHDFEKSKLFYEYNAVRTLHLGYLDREILKQSFSEYYADYCKKDKGSYKLGKSPYTLMSWNFVGTLVTDFLERGPYFLMPHQFFKIVYNSNKLDPCPDMYHDNGRFLKIFKEMEEMCPKMYWTVSQLQKFNFYDNQYRMDEIRKLLLQNSLIYKHSDLKFQVLQVYSILIYQQLNYIGEEF